MEKSSSRWIDWIKAIFIAGFAAILFRAVQSAGWAGGLNVQGKELTLGISFLVGVAASFSSCLAVVGGMVIAFSAKYQIVILLGAGIPANEHCFEDSFCPVIGAQDKTGAQCT